ncbi:hypothetical protein, partial [Escherichia coli]|uniref:hypothetical protein n=1 Tax=Escherichia coli TaxID=562 RepID=UPI0028DF059C
GVGTIQNDDSSNVVNTVADNTLAGDGLTTLREAILFANANPGSTITFNIPAAQAVGNVFTIRPATVLPSITADGTIVDGNTQTF